MTNRTLGNLIFIVNKKQKIIIDGILFVHYNYPKESALEKAVIEHADHIFGRRAFFLPKKRLSTHSGTLSIPDGFVLDFGKQCWHVVEVELSSHDPYKHILPQLTKFYNSLQGRPRMRQELVDIFYNYFRQNPLENARLREILGDNEIFRTIRDIVIHSEPRIVIIVDDVTAQLREAIIAMPQQPQILRFETYIRADIMDPRIHLHLFDSLADEGETAVYEKAATPYPEKISESDLARLAKENRYLDKVLKYFNKKVDEDRETTTQWFFYKYILQTLIEVGGQAKRSKIIEIVFQKTQPFLRKGDYEAIPSGAIRWSNRVAWAGLDLSLAGCIEREHGAWKITPLGEKVYEVKSAERF